MARRGARLILGAALLVGCASVHPVFEQRINDHAAWTLFLTTHYACDTVLLRYTGANRPAGGGMPGRRIVGQNVSVTSPLIGSSPCQVATWIPNSVRGFRTEEGWREEWLSNAAVVYRFEGPSQSALRLVNVYQ